MESLTSIAQQLAELAAKHRSLEAGLAEAFVHLDTTDDEITALKRQKLRIKDRISALEKPMREEQSMPET